MLQTIKLFDYEDLDFIDKKRIKFFYKNKIK